jgi:D-alanyl-lipoteichoic acid acyltransferase DltB (MBOAT superfamily)
MLFNSYPFLFVFLPVFLAVFYWLKTTTGRLYFLLASSIVFFGIWSPFDLLVLLSSITFTYACSLKIHNSENSLKKSLYLTICISGNLIALCYFKYWPFIIALFEHKLSGDSLGGGQFANPELPLGISFFIFHQIGYSLLVRSGIVKPPEFTNYATFVAFFPQLIAGPIVDSRCLMPQLKRLVKSRKVSAIMAAAGLTVFSIGIFKKVVLADYLGSIADKYFSAARSGEAVTAVDSIIGSISYTFQLYFDFSGYSDMAIGLGLLVGIKIPLNFYSPLKSVNIVDFWRRWHITLGRFFNDFLFLPLSVQCLRPLKMFGIRALVFLPIAETIPIILTFTILGFWHGAGLTFIIFGAWHGLGVAICNLWGRYSPINLPAAISWVINFLFVVIGFLFFRAENALTIKTFFEAFLKLENYIWIAGNRMFDSADVYAITVAGAIILFFPATVQLAPRFIDTRLVAYTKGIFNSKLRWRPNFVWAAYSGVLFAISLLTLSEPKSFLYFQF